MKVGLEFRLKTWDHMLITRKIGLQLHGCKIVHVIGGFQPHQGLVVGVVEDPG